MVYRTRMITPPSRHGKHSGGIGRTTVSAILTLLLFESVAANELPIAPRGSQAQAPEGTRKSTPTSRGSLSGSWNGKIPLVVTNKCDDTIWPGLATQAGSGPDTGGFELSPGRSKQLWVSGDWQGRVWGRTNCTADGDSCKCKTGDCLGKLSCEYSGQTPATLAEFNLAGGATGDQTFYDISLVDGYNLPVGLKYIPSNSTTFIPPNLTNAACIATSGWLYNSSGVGTYYANSSYPIPLETHETNKEVEDWCPWPLLAFPPTKPGDGVYPYPDDNIKRPTFSPCFSACAKTGSDKDCCVGRYHDSKICKPSGYSVAAKAMCPDAYSYAFDDQSSSFAIPKGGGWEVIMCPKGRSTNILRQLGNELNELGRTSKLSAMARQRLGNVTYIEADKGLASGLRPCLRWTMVLVLAALIAFMVA